LGATPDQNGVNFSLVSQHATSVELLLFDRHNAPQPTQVIQLNLKINKIFYIWHVYVKGLKPGAVYAYRVDGLLDLHIGIVSTKIRYSSIPMQNGRC
jgi:isoamylase